MISSICAHCHVISLGSATCLFCAHAKRGVVCPFHGRIPAGYPCPACELRRALADERAATVLSMRITVAQMHLALLESQLAVERIRAAMQQSEIDALRLRLALLEGRQHA